MTKELKRDELIHAFQVMRDHLDGMDLKVKDVREAEKVLAVFWAWFDRRVR